MTSVLLYLILSLTKPALAVNPVEHCQTFIGSCQYYQCLTAVLGCKAKDYPLQFGYRYCDRFDHSAKNFSNRGQAFLQGVKTCLQEQLSNSEDLTCESTQELSPEHHVRCYAQNNFCEISDWDKARIGGIVLDTYITSPEFRHTGEEIFRACKKHKN